MNKILYRLLVFLICVFSLCCAFVSICFIFLSEFMVFELDFNDIQRQAAETKAWLITFSGIVGLCLSILLLLFSVRIVGFVLNVLGIKFTK